MKRPVSLPASGHASSNEAAASDGGDGGTWDRKCKVNLTAVAKPRYVKAKCIAGTAGTLLAYADEDADDGPARPSGIVDEGLHLSRGELRALSIGSRCQWPPVVCSRLDRSKFVYLVAEAE